MRDDYEKLGAFYLGRTLSGSAPLLYDSKDLVTHAVCVGMTGSGKTGLCTALLEEAAIDGVPAIVIDPKGDLTNLLLQFPNLTAEEFEPWVAPEDAERNGLPVADWAARQAASWREGLAAWGQSGERLRKLSEAADFSIYTPGSSAGLPLSILKSFSPPSAGADDPELMQERVAVTATAVLSLLGIDAEPMKSREHILLSMILDHAWKEGRSLDLAALIHAIQEPAFTRVGVLDLDSFFGSGERFELAMKLNNLMASPGFASWLEGEPLDVARLLRTPQGKPRISILSIAHLADAERMFFVTLLLNEVLSWTRMQSGTSSLRAILYMDEIFGYFPPVSNPPSKKPLLTLLKQARAFGVGVVLATQNPVDLDYKGLANAGTWLIGRLQAERDKERLLDGLEGASSVTGSSFNRQQMSELLSSLGKRKFLLNNVHDDAPIVFESRWALSYLRGPLTRSQIRSLMEGKRGDGASPMAKRSPSAAHAQVEAGSSRTMLAPEIAQVFVPVRGETDGVVYQPALLASAQVRFVDTKAKLDYLKDAVFVTPVHDDSLPVQWEECFEANVDPSELETSGIGNAQYASVPAAAGKPKSYPGWNKQLIAWIYSHQQISLLRSQEFGIVSSPAEQEAEFRARVAQCARESRDLAVEKIRTKYAARVSTLQDRLRRAEQAVHCEKEQAQSETLSSVLSVGTGLLGAVFGRRISGAAAAARSVGRARRSSQDVGRAEENAAALRQQLNDLEAEIADQMDSLTFQAELAAQPLETVCIKPKKTNIAVRLFSFAWMPYRRDATGAATPAWE